MMARVSRPAGIALLVACSGFSSLIYQVVWERTLRYSFGGDSVSAAIVTGTFLLGLGLGAVVFGRWLHRPFTVYALVEAAIGCYGLASFWVLAPLAGALNTLFGGAIADAEGLRPAVVVAAVLFLLPPCILIGGTGPLMFNCFVRGGAYRASRVGWLYAVNTAGAAAGVLAAPFLLLNRFSLPVTLAIIAGLNLAVAAVLWHWARSQASSELGEIRWPRRGPDPSAVAPAAPAARPVGLRLPLWPLAFGSGFVSLAFEVSLIRALFVLNPSSPYNFPAALIPFLLALAAGSALFTRGGADEPARALRRAGWLFVAAVAAMLLAVTASAMLSLAGVRPLALEALAADAAFVLHAVLLGASLPLFLGAVLPLLLRLAAPTGEALPARTGTLYLVNSAGAFAGALLTQFAGFPTVGTRGVLLALFWLGLAAGTVCLWRGSAGGRRPALALLPLAGLAVAPLALPAVVWRVYASGFAAASVERIEGVTGVAAIDWHPAGGDVFVNGQFMSRLPDHPRHVRLVSFALALPRRDAVLLLGLGGGGMVRELAKDPGIGRLEVVDWSYELPRLLDGPRARRLLDDALRRSHVTVRRCDARVAVGLYDPASFDVVIDNLTIGHWVGATSVKSIQYFRQVHRIVKPGGVFVYHGNWGGARRAILAGLTGTFRHVHLHPGRDPVEEVVLASDRPLDFDAAHVQALLERLRATTGIAVPGRLVEGLSPVGREQLGRARPVRDDLLVYEYHRDPVRAVKRWARELGRSLLAAGAGRGRALSP
jgi:spermidine synthase